MSSNIRKLSNMFRRGPGFFGNPNYSKLEKVYYPFVGICTIGGFTFGCKISLDNINSYKNIEDKIDKTAINLFGATMYGILIGVCAPITIPTFVIVAYNEITKIT